jgi:ABC-type sugar transport system ATPase subunit
VKLPPRSAAKVRLEVKNLSRRGQFEDVSFAVHAGEAVGLYGLMGAGHAALGTCLFGLLSADAGEVLIDGERIRLSTPIRAKAAGIAYTPEDRRRSLVQTVEVFKNVTLPHLKQVLGPKTTWLIKSKRETKVTQDQITELRVKVDSPRRRVDTLSGGNQQKVVLAKWLCYPPRVIVLSEPTRGIDVAAKADIAEHVAQMKEKGLAIVVISNEPETIMAMSDRILAFSKGRVVAELADTVVTKASMMEII